MKLIKVNPYRILGLLAGASTREISRQTNRLHKIIAAEQESSTDDFSFPALGNLVRTEETIEEATSKLNLDSDKLNAALFWFWNGNPITDEVAFESLKEGKIEEAYQIWDKLIIETRENNKRFWRTVTVKNSSAFHNSFVLEMLRPNGDISTAIVANLYFLESEFSKKFISSIADSTYKTNTKEMQIDFLNDVLLETEKGNVNITLSKFISIINSVDFIAKSDFLIILSRKFANNISTLIDTTRKERTANKGNALKAGDELSKQSKNNLEQLKLAVGIESFSYSNTADKVANEILQCSVDFFNYCQGANSAYDYYNSAMKLARQAEYIAVGNLTKERIKENINTLEEMKDIELSQAISLLKSIKDAYEANKTKITAEAHAMPLGYNQSINWSKVNQMIEKSLDWDKVVELILKTITQSNIEKIKRTNNSVQINEYKSLANFLISKLSFVQVNKVKYICYWKTENAVSNAELTVKSLPAWSKWCLGIAVFLLIVGLIWGEEGLSVMLWIAAFLGAMFFIGWVQNLIR